MRALCEAFCEVKDLAMYGTSVELSTKNRDDALRLLVEKDPKQQIIGLYALANTWGLDRDAIRELLEVVVRGEDNFDVKRYAVFLLGTNHDSGCSYYIMNVLLRLVCSDAPDALRMIAYFVLMNQALMNRIVYPSFFEFATPSRIRHMFAGTARDPVGSFDNSFLEHVRVITRHFQMMPG
jgi:hypothetical protein